MGHMVLRQMKKAGAAFYDDFEYADPGDATINSSKWIVDNSGPGFATIISGNLYATTPVPPVGDPDGGLIYITPCASAGVPVDIAPSRQRVGFTAAAAPEIAVALNLRYSANVDASVVTFSYGLLGNTISASDTTGTVLWTYDWSEDYPSFTFTANDLVEFEVVETAGVAAYTVYVNGVAGIEYDDATNANSASHNSNCQMLLYTYKYTILSAPGLFGIKDFTFDGTAPIPLDPTFIYPGNLTSSGQVYNFSISAPALFRNRWVENTPVTAGTAFPTYASYFNFKGIGAGGGGGSGRYAATGSIRWGGGGGAGGGYLQKLGQAISGLGTHGCTLGSAGTAGANQGTISNNGLVGGDGGDVSFTTSSGLVLAAKGGPGGGAGTATTGAGGTAVANVATSVTPTVNNTGGSGAASNAGTATPSAGGSSGNAAGGGGGAGGGLASSPTARAGSTGGAVTTPSQAGGAGGAATGAGTNGSALVLGQAASGGGGSGSATTTGTRAAGSGVGYGAGGGGGGAKQAASTQAAGSGGPAYNRIDYTATASAQLLSGAAAYTQSSVYSGTVAATAANMNDQNAAGSSGNSAGTNSAAGAYIRCDLGSSKACAQVIIGVDYNSSMPGGWSPAYFVGRTLEYSTNGTSWTTFTTFPAWNSANYPDGLVPFDVTGVTARYWRVYSAAANFVQATEFQVWG